jgi:hypothetical protein
MMLFEKIDRDERTVAAGGRVAGIWLGITHVLLAGVIFYRLYVLGQPDAEIRDFQAILAISIFGHMITQLFLGGLLPVPTWRGIVVAYVVLAGIVVAVCLAVYGVPEPAQWHNTWLPTLLGPALFLGLYRLVAWLGRRRIERLISD